MRHWYLPHHPHQRLKQSFTEWLETYVGEYGKDWWRTYDMDRESPTFGTTWNFQDEKKAMWTLLRWA